MSRALLVVLAAVCTLSGAGGATACVSLVPAERLPGETDAQLVDRAKRMHQDDLRSRADAVFLAQVSAARMVGQLAADYTLTPFYPLYDSAPSPETVVVRDSPIITGCHVRPELGHVYAVYAEQSASGWRVIEIVRHGDLQDRPPGLPTARDVARGDYALPAYAD